MTPIKGKLAFIARCFMLADKHSITILIEKIDLGNISI